MKFLTLSISLALGSMLIATISRSDTLHPLESRFPNEEETIGEIKSTIESTMDKAYPEGSFVLRDVQTKAHGCVTGEFTINPDLVPELRVGVFAEPGKAFPAVIRYSSTSNHISSDTKKDGRGMAIKLFGINGPKVLESEELGETLDFLMVNNKTFFADSPAAQLEFAKLRAQTDNNLELAFQYVFPSFNPKNWKIEDGKSILSVFFSNVVNPLHADYFSISPYKFGDKKVMKFSAQTCKGDPLVKADSRQSDNHLREAMAKQLSDDDACFDFNVQFINDGEDVESLVKAWDEKKSPFVSVARLHIPKQAFSTQEQDAACENLSFNPWRTIEEHRPLGVINRIRRVMYKTISIYRHQRNGVDRVEPKREDWFKS